ncbi:polysaccharide biosynthesis tyrosine autokinase [Candidimonas sp. SYP-B2681]|uniref:polysaccharide biosynthesis tyrosine autokinase n=1 Tax=Candidimonas sp. SYP-B2681 TaxID=2497686 RepID=UPI001F3726C2|nr:polysaccharide biosynthesis tyrosine autokinase [Candidimonas sp. SYP-B2681]
MNNSDMNKQYPLAQAGQTAPIIFAPPYGPPNNDDIDFLGVLDTALNSRWLIASVLMIALLIGGAYALFSQPIYRSDVLIQVEQNPTTSTNQNILSELSTVFNIQSPATAEIEILRSRLVIGHASDQLQLYVDAAPDYLPIVGSWLAKHATELSTPRLFKIGSYLVGGYVWGTESIKVAQLDVPEKLENEKLTLTTTLTGYELHGPGGEKLAQGKVGVPNEIKLGKQTGTILISNLNARPAARFTLVRRSRQNIIQDLQDDLLIDEKGKPSGVLSMTLDGPDPERITAILNAIGLAYVKQNTERKAAEAEKSLEFLEGFLPQLRRQMDASDNKYTAFRDLHGTFNLGTEGTLSLNRSVAMQTQLFELQQKRRELGAQFGVSHPTIQALNGQISALESEVGRLTAHIKTLPELEQQLLNLMRDVKVNGELYAGLLNSAQQLRLVKEGKVGNVRMVDTADTPEFPIKPHRPLVLAIAGLLGLLLGIGIALLRGFLRNGVKAANDIESSLGLNVFATVPHVQQGAYRQSRFGGRSGTNYVLAESSPDDPAIESLRSLRTSLPFALQDAPNNIIMLTGPTPNIGKTFTSVNLAAVMGAADKRVLLIDADFRSGGVHRYFGLERYNGFSDLIRGTATLQQVLHKSIITNVDLITTGVLPHNPAELLLSPMTMQLLHEISVNYDVVLVDTAPVLPVSDAMALAPHVGTIFMLARAQVSTLHELEESTKRLNQAGAQVKGVIFNDFDASSQRFSSRYGSYHQSYVPYGTNRS